MKKIFTTLLSAAIISSAFAQSNYPYNDQQNEKSINQNFHNDPRYERDKEIDQVNYQNNFQVQQLVNDPYLNIWEKKEALDALEFQRMQKINSIYQKYSNSVAFFTSNKRNNSFERMNDHNNNEER